MSSILEIARSGILAYQASLAVTGENIANVNTAGYARQSVALGGATGGQATATTAPGAGGGVLVQDVLRAFDGLLADRARAADGAQVAASVRLDQALAVETLFIPGAGGIDTALSGFFTAMSALAANAADTTLRQIALDSGATLAATVADVALGVQGLRRDIASAATTAADTVNRVLSDLAGVQAAITPVSVGGSAVNTLYTRRDALLAELGGLVGVTTRFDDLGRAEVTLGEGGTVLLRGAEAARVGVTLDDRLTLTTTGPSGQAETRLVGSGTLQGLSLALGSVTATGAELDAFSAALVTGMNALHMAGRDFTGAAGGPMFAAEGWQASAAATNQGSAQVRAVASGGTAPGGPITLIRSADGLWQATGADGAVLGAGASGIALPGLDIAISGTAVAGDRITLEPASGRASDLRFLLTDPRQLAAAAPDLVSPALSNTGTANARITATSLPSTGWPGAATALAGAGDAAGALNLLGPGIVGTLPASSGPVTLATLGRQATLDFALPAGGMTTASALSVTLDGVAHGFDLTQMADGSAPPAAWGAADLAVALNAGELLADGLSLADLGMRAAGTAEGQLTLVAVRGSLSAGRITGGSAIDAYASPAAGAGGTAQVFTRNGLHLAGAPLDAAEAAALLTEANGFLPGAVYDASLLNGDYRGMEADVISLPGRQGLALEPAAISVWSGTPPAAAAAQAVGLDMAGQPSASITLPEGASAAQAAQLLDGALPGLRASATTAVALTVAGDGQLSFGLATGEGAPVTVTASVSAGGLAALAAEITRSAPATGLRAEVSADGSRLLLVQDAGETITLTGLTHSGGGTLSLTPGAADGTPLAGAAVLGSGADSARIAGQVRLEAVTAFGVTRDGLAQASAVDGTRGGLVSVTSAGAGSQRILGFSFDPALDGPGQAADGSVAVAAGTRYSVTLGGTTATVSGGDGIADAADLALAMAVALRANTPTATLTGAALTGLPADGTQLPLTVDGQSYTLTMQDGQPTVLGPETGRLSAGFDAANRLVLRLAGSTDGSGIGLSPTDSPAARAFGLSVADAPVTRFSGTPIDAAALPSGGATLAVTLGGTRYDLTISAPGGALVAETPADFPGLASIGAQGELSLEIPAHLGAVTVAPAPAAGFATLGARVAADGADLVLTSTDGAVLNLAAGAEALATQRLSLSDLPAEELLVAVTGTGVLRLQGSIGDSGGTVAPEAVQVTVLDAASGKVGLIDSGTGDVIATSWLDGQGAARLGGYLLRLEGAAATGDSFGLSPTGAGSADGTAADAFRALSTGTGSLTARFTALQSGIGSLTAAARNRLETVSALNEAAQTDLARVQAVDLDAEAASLIALQQAYQGSARTLQVAQELFDTLLKVL